MRDKMRDYISREAVLSTIWKTSAEHDLFFPAIILDAIKAIPASDVRPVVRGHWISEEEAEEKGDYSLRDACSVCGHCDWDCTESASFNYCPNCGADMREES